MNERRRLNDHRNLIVVAVAEPVEGHVPALNHSLVRLLVTPCLIGAPQGVERMRGVHPDVPIWAAAIDDTLDERAFILPGLGDAGDRAYGTK